MFIPDPNFFHPGSLLGKWNKSYGIIYKQIAIEAVFWISKFEHSEGKWNKRLLKVVLEYSGFTAGLHSESGSLSFSWIWSGSL
jgi:hypothetical protein